MQTITLSKILSALALGCLIAGMVIFGLVRAAVTTDAGKIARIGAEIADFRLPDGYHLQYGVQALGYTLVAAAPQQGSEHIFLAQAPYGSKLERLFGNGLVSIVPGRRNTSRPRDVVIIGTQEAVLRGEPVTLALGEGVNSSNETYRELTGLFNGRGGPAMVNISAPLSQWDETSIASFLATIQ